MSKQQLPLFPAQPTKPEDVSKQTPLGATFDLFSQYLRKEGKSEHTIKAFMGDMRLLAEHTGIQTPISQYLTTTLNAFLQWMEHERGVPCSRKTYARRVTTLKVFFKWLTGLKAIPHDPAQALLQRSGPAPLSDTLNHMQIRDCLHYSQTMKKGDESDTRPELLLWLLLDTGIKKSEAGQLTLEDIDRSNPNYPTVLIHHTRRNVYKERRLNLDAGWLELLDLYRQQYQPKTTIFTCTTRNLEYILKDIGEGAYIPFKLSFEVLRWTSAVRDYRNGIDEDQIREKLGLSQTSWYETGNKIRRIAQNQAEEEGRR